MNEMDKIIETLINSRFEFISALSTSVLVLIIGYILRLYMSVKNIREDEIIIKINKGDTTITITGDSNTINSDKFKNIIIDTSNKVESIDEAKEKKRLEFIRIIKEKCTFNTDLEHMKLDGGSGYASKNFKILRQGDKPWMVRKGDLITWSNEKFLMIQQMEHAEPKAIESAKKEESLLNKIFGAIEQAAAEQGKKHMQKMFTRRFDIQWKNINDIGD